MECPRRIVVPTYDGMHILKVSDIIRCESSSNYTNFLLKDAKPILASKTLKEYDIMLSPHNFERIHKSHLINMAYVKRYVPSDGGYMIMEDDLTHSRGESEKRTAAQADTEHVDMALSRGPKIF